MRSEIQSGKDIGRLGLECLTHMENEMIALGISEQDVEQTIAPLMRLQIEALKGQFFNLK